MARRMIAAAANGLGLGQLSKHWDAWDRVGGVSESGVVTMME